MKITAEEISKIQDQMNLKFDSVQALKLSDSHLLWTVEGVRVAETVKSKDSLKTTYLRGRYAGNRVSSAVRSKRPSHAR